VTDEDAARTESMTTAAVTKFWFDKYPWKGSNLDDVEQMVVNRVVQLIESEDCLIDGVKPFIARLKAENYKVGLATNSPNTIILAVLRKLGEPYLFDAISSSEFEVAGKPDPAIYLTTASKLDVETKDCIAIEDSYAGMQAAKKAGMTVVAFTNGCVGKRFDIADYEINRFEECDVSVCCSKIG
jgi:haloacid dehalogenase superfamily, subfamily IA, variant 3 with third motif having DD or ED